MQAEGASDPQQKKQKEIYDLALTTLEAAVDSLQSTTIPVASDSSAFVTSFAKLLVPDEPLKWSSACQALESQFGPALQSVDGHELLLPGRYGIALVVKVLKKVGDYEGHVHEAGYFLEKLKNAVLARIKKCRPPPAADVGALPEKQPRQKTEVMDLSADSDDEVVKIEDDFQAASTSAAPLPIALPSQATVQAQAAVGKRAGKRPRSSTAEEVVCSSGAKRTASTRRRAPKSQIAAPKVYPPRPPHSSLTDPFSWSIPSISPPPSLPPFEDEFTLWKSSSFPNLNPDVSGSEVYSVAPAYHFLPSRPGEPGIIFGDDRPLQSFRGAGVAKNLFVKVSSRNRYQYRGRYEIYWEGYTTSEELKALVGDERSSLVDLFKQMSLAVGCPHRAWGFWTSTAEAMLKELSENASIRIPLAVVRCVGFDAEGLTTWIANKGKREKMMAKEERKQS